MDISPDVPIPEARKRRRFSPEQIQSHLDAFSQSQVSAAEFCRQHNLGYATFQRWRQCRSTPAKAEPQFESIALSGLLAPGWAAEVALPNGCTLRLQATVSPGWVASVLEALRRSC